MAGNIKGITIEFQGETTKLDSALRKIKTSTKGLDKDLKDVNRALKFNPTSVELWRQKQTLLEQKISQTKKNLEELKSAQAQLDAKGVDKNSAEYQRLQREIITTESKLKTFKRQQQELGNVKLRAVSEQFKELGSKLETAGQKMKGLSVAAAAVVGSLAAVAVKAGKAADDINTMSKVYGIGTKELQLYGAAADLADVDVETIAKSHVKLEKTMYSAANGSKETAAAYAALGVDIKNADGSFRSSDEVFQDVISSLGNMKDETQRDAIAMQLMGKSAAELNPLIEDGGETYKNLADTLAKYDLQVVDQDSLDNANQFNDSLDTIKAIGLVTFQQIGTELAATLAPVLEKVVDWVGRLAQWLTNLSPTTLTVLGIIASVVAVLGPVLIVIGKVATGISAIMSLAGAIGPMLGALAGPVGIVIAIIAALVAIGVLLYKNWDTIKAKAAELWANIKSVFEGIKNTIMTVWNTIKAFIFMIIKVIVLSITTRFNILKTVVTTVFTTIKTVVTKIWNGIKTAITKPIQTAVNIIRTAINKIKSIINGARLSLPKFKLPHFKITGGKLPWGIGGKGKKPTISVDWYAQGAIFRKPTLLGAGAALKGVGEAGAEAVLPLDLLWDNMRAMADSIVNGVVSAQQMQAAGAPINITLYAYPSGPKMEQWVVDTYDAGKRRLG